MGKIHIHVHTKDADFGPKAYEASKALISVGMKITQLMNEAKKENDPSFSKLKTAFEALERARNLLSQI